MSTSIPPLVERRNAMRISADRIETATGIPASVVDRTLADPHRLSRLPVSTARKLIGVLDIDTLADLTPKQRGEDPQQSSKTTAVANVIALLQHANSPVARAHLQIAIKPAEVPSADQLNSAVRGLGLIVTETGNLLQLVPDPSCVPSGQYVELATVQTRTSDPTPEQAAILYSKIKKLPVDVPTTEATVMATAGLLTPGNNCPTNDLRFSIERVIQDAVPHRAGFKKFTRQNSALKQQTLVLDE